MKVSTGRGVLECGRFRHLAAALGGPPASGQTVA